MSDVDHAKQKQVRFKKIWLLPFVLLSGLLVLLFFRLGADTHMVPEHTVNKRLPAFELPNLLNPQETLNPDSLPNTPFILNVWGSWCPSCHVEHPFMMKLADKGVNFVGVNYQDELVDALAYLEKGGNPYSQVIQDYDGTLSIGLGLTGAPESFLVDAEGQIRQHLVGKITEENWRKRLQPCLQALQTKASSKENAINLDRICQ